MIVDEPVHESESSDSESEGSDDDAEVEETEETTFSKAGFQIISLHHLDILPVPRLIVCEKCLLGVMPSAVLKHYKVTHAMNLHLHLTQKASGTTKDHFQKVQVQAFFAQHPIFHLDQCPARCKQQIEVATVTKME